MFFKPLLVNIYWYKLINTSTLIHFLFKQIKIDIFVLYFQMIISKGLHTASIEKRMMPLQFQFHHCCCNPIVLLYVIGSLELFVVLIENITDTSCSLPPWFLADNNVITVNQVSTITLALYGHIVWFWQCYNLILTPDTYILFTHIICVFSIAIWSIQFALEHSILHIAVVGMSSYFALSHMKPNGSKITEHVDLSRCLC